MPLPTVDRDAAFTVLNPKPQTKSQSCTAAVVRKWSKQQTQIIYHDIHYYIHNSKYTVTVYKYQAIPCAALQEHFQECK